MGLDWKPLNKPKKGYEKEYSEIFLLLSEKQERRFSFLDKIFGKRQRDQQELLDRFFDISIQAYQTLNAPRVGFDDNATKWATEKYKDRTDKSQTLEAFLQSMNGYYVVELVEGHDGIPTYIAPHDEPHVFRAKFLHDCEDIIGEEMLEEAYTSQLSDKAIDFGIRLMDIADNYAREHNLEHLKEERIPPDSDEMTPESNAHILFSAAKWILWWAERGHGYEADF